MPSLLFSNEIIKQLKCHEIPKRVVHNVQVKAEAVRAGLFGGCHFCVFGNGAIAAIEISNIDFLKTHIVSLVIF